MKQGVEEFLLLLKKLSAELESQKTEFEQHKVDYGKMKQVANYVIHLETEKKSLMGVIEMQEIQIRILKEQLESFEFKVQRPYGSEFRFKGLNPEFRFKTAKEAQYVKEALAPKPIHSWGL